MSVSVRKRIIAALGFTGLVAGCLPGQSPGRLAPSTMIYDQRLPAMAAVMIDYGGAGRRLE